METEEVVVTQKRPGWVKLVFLLILIFIVSVTVSLILWAFLYFNRKSLIPVDEINAVIDTRLSNLQQEIFELRTDIATRIAAIESSLPSRSAILDEVRLRIAEEVNRITSIEEINEVKRYVDLQLQQIDVRFNSLSIAPNVTIYDEDGERKGSFSGLQFVGSEITAQNNVCIISNASKFWINKSNYTMTAKDYYVEIGIDEAEINSTFAFDMYLTLSVDLEKYLQCQHYTGVIRIGVNGDAYLANNTVGVVTVSGETDSLGNDGPRTISTNLSVAGKIIRIKMLPNLSFQNTSIEVSVQYRSFEL